MIRIHQMKLPVESDSLALQEAILQKLHISPDTLLSYEIVRRSLDARRGRALSYVYSVDVSLKGETSLWNRLRRIPGLERRAKRETYQAPSLPSSVRESLGQRHPRPIVVGFGPAGIFCALLLARAGFAPLIVERGRTVEARWQDVKRFWENGILDPQSNVQFGEGGAGTFSDGKLTTLVRDPECRGRYILEEMVQAGAPEEILYAHKPHIGTDVLITVMGNLRQKILRLGGEIWFETTLVDLREEQGRVVGVTVERRGADFPLAQRQDLEASHVFLGIGHSARDTFSLLERIGVPMEPKAFSVGVRIEQLQSDVNRVQYHGAEMARYLGPADYKLAHHSRNGRGVYTFCMCPGGHVVAAASEPGGLVTNGMSYFRRDHCNANAAVLVSVSPSDFLPYGNSVLAGVAFQRELEQKAFQLGGANWKAPVQLAQDFCLGQRSSGLGRVAPSFSGGYTLADLRELFPSCLTESLREGLLAFEGQLPGFVSGDAVLTGVESRSSSPVRFLRNEALESPIAGLFPIGEGAGHAGGIMSAAMDGMKAAESYMRLLSFS